MPRQRREWKIYNEDIKNSFTQHQTQITQLSDSITLQAATITSLDDKVEEYYSELVVADQGITSTVATKVGADTIISTINQSSESVTINASKIGLNGYVTFTNLAAYGDHTIALGDGTNTLTIDGSTITGTNASGHIGYKLRPSSIDIYSFTSSNDLVGRLAATKSSVMGAGDVGIALFADTSDWLTLGRINSNNQIDACFHCNPANGNTGICHAGDSLSQIFLTSTNTYIRFGGANGYNQDSSGLTLGNDSMPVTVHSSNYGVCYGNDDYARLSNGAWAIRGASGVFAGPTTGTSKRGFRFDSSEVYVYNDTTNSTYIVLSGSSIDLYAQSGKIQMYGPDSHSLYLGSSGLMYDGKWVRVESTKTAAGQS